MPTTPITITFTSSVAFTASVAATPPQPVTIPGSASIPGPAAPNFTVGTVNFTGPKPVGWAITSGDPNKHFAISLQTDGTGLLRTSTSPPSSGNYALTIQPSGSSMVNLPAGLYESLSVDVGPMFILPPIVVSTGSSLPAGAALQQIDGGPTYYADNGFSVAASARTFNGVTYSNGWDTPTFLSISPFLCRMDSSADATRWQTIGLNTATLLAGTSAVNQFDLCLNNGISYIQNYPEIGIALQRSSRPFGQETVAWYTFDEPQTVDQLIRVPVVGNASATFTNCTYVASTILLTIGGTVTGGNALPTDLNYQHPAILTGSGITGSATTATLNNYETTPKGGGSGAIYALISTGSFSGITITQDAVPPLTSSMIGGRFLESTFPGVTFFSNTVYAQNDRPGNVPLDTVLGTLYTAADGSSRFLSLFGYDAYFFCFAHDATPFNGRKQSVTNMYDTVTGSTIMTIGQTAKGPHYGNFIDYMRSYQTTFSVPMWAAIDNSESKTQIAYDTPGVEFNWSIWSTLIHGGRSVTYFNSVSTFSPSGCNGAPGADNFQCTVMQNPQSVTFTGSISGTTLSVTPGTVTSTSTQGAAVPSLYPGMVATSGVTGTSYIMQQMSTQISNFAGTVASSTSTTLVVSSVNVSPIVVPSWLSTAVNLNGIGFALNTQITAQLTGPAGSSGTYTINQTPSSAIGSAAMGAVAVNAGVDGTWRISGGTGSGTMSYVQSNAGVGGTGTPIFLGGTATQQGMTTLATATNTRVRDMAPVLNSPFVVAASSSSPGYLVSTNPAAAYIFPSNTGVKNTFPPVTFAYGTQTGMDLCVKKYAGSTYTTTAGDSITAGYYIFATTRFEENNTQNLSVTFTINDPGATSITVLGESRTINFTSGIGSSHAVFSDTFDFAWTVRIYKVNH